MKTTKTNGREYRGRVTKRPVTPFGKRVEKFAEAKDLTLWEFLSKAKIGYVTWHQYKYGLRSPGSPAILCRMADALGVSVDQILGR